MIKKLLVKIYIKANLLLIRQRAVRKLVSFGKDVEIDLYTKMEGRNSFGRNVNIASSEIGLGTYIAENSILRQTEIGRFCSIGNNVKAGLGTHPVSDFVSTHPAFFSEMRQAGFSFVNDSKFAEHPSAFNSHYTVSIGHDVWIGADVVILDGIRIGNGAIIGANSTVTRNIEDYAIYAGTPARLIRYRFPKTERDWLKNFCWWDREFDWISKNAHLFSSIDLLRSEFIYNKDT